GRGAPRAAGGRPAAVLSGTAVGSPPSGNASDVAAAVFPASSIRAGTWRPASRSRNGDSSTAQVTATRPDFTPVSTAGFTFTTLETSNVLSPTAKLTPGLSSG